MPVRRSLLSVPVLAVLGLVTLLVAATLTVDATAAETRARIDRTMKDPNIVESSGLARSGFFKTRLWTHNDSGGGDTIYAIGKHGRTVGKYRLLNTRHWDWEAMASGRHRGVSNLFVGEIGDNRRAKSSIFVYRLREPKPTAPNGTRTPRSFEFVYPDGRHDAEALLVRPGSLRIFIVTKDRNNAAIYAAPRNPSTSRINRLKRVRSAPAIITDGVFVTKNRFVLRGYNTGYVYRSLTAKPRTFKIPDSGESITKGIRRGTVLTGSEGRHSDVWRVPFN